MKPNRAVANWLFLLCIMVFGMTVGGGHARTIGASFIMQSWQPVTGFLPPMRAAAWAAQFALFQQTAAFQAHPISLATYKTLFWPMFLDRDWGRLMALVFLLPMAWFWWTRRISTKLALWLIGIFAAGGAQALFGWFLVLSGRHPGVLTPPALLAAPHFCAAMLIFCALLWTALSLRNPTPSPAPGGLRVWVSASVLLVLLTMGFGALVASTNAITVFNTFPLMDGRWVPIGLFAQTQATVQFFHRALATMTALTVLLTAVLGLREARLTQGQRDLFLLLAGLVALQYLLGMATIVLGSQNLGFFHELNGVLLLATAVATRHSLGSGRFFEKKAGRPPRFRKKLLPPLATGGETTSV